MMVKRFVSKPEHHILIGFTAVFLSGYPHAASVFYRSQLSYRAAYFQDTLILARWT